MANQTACGRTSQKRTVWSYPAVARTTDGVAEGMAVACAVCQAKFVLGLCGSSPHASRLEVVSGATTPNFSCCLKPPCAGQHARVSAGHGSAVYAVPREDKGRGQQ